MKEQLESLRRTILDRLYEVDYGTLEWHRWMTELRNVAYLLGQQP